LYVVEEKVHYALPRITEPWLRSEWQRSLVLSSRCYPSSPAGLAKLFLFESRLPENEALTELKRRGPCTVRGGCIPNTAITGRKSITANHSVHLPSIILHAYCLEYHPASMIPFDGVIISFLGACAASDDPCSVAYSAAMCPPLSTSLIRPRCFSDRS
jgi:hypothetical protein